MSGVRFLLLFCFWYKLPVAGKFRLIKPCYRMNTHKHMKNKSETALKAKYRQCQRLNIFSQNIRRVKIHAKGTCMLAYGPYLHLKQDIFKCEKQLPGMVHGPLSASVSCFSDLPFSEALLSFSVSQTFYSLARTDLLPC